MILLCAKIALFVMMTIQVMGCKVEAFSYQAALIADASKFCSGAFVSAGFVVTLAECVENAFEIDVIVGSTDLHQRSTDEEAKICTDIRVHPTADVALVGFPGSVPIRRTIRPVEIPHGLLDPLPDLSAETPAILTGWSAISNGSKVLTGKLSIVEIVELMDDAECREKLSREDGGLVLAETLGDIGIVCTQKPPDGIHDLGSPLVVNNVLVGILIREQGALLVFFKMGAVYDWITTTSYRFRR